MDLALTDEQQALRRVFAEFFAKESPPSRVRAAEPLGFDDALWSQVTRTGATTMGLPEDLGGGASMLDLVLLAQEFGKHIAPVPLIECVVTNRALARAGARDLVEDVRDGALVATLALTPTIDGLARLVPGGAVAEIVLARDGDDLVALRRPTGTRPYDDSTPNLGSVPLSDWHVKDPRVERLVVASGPDAGLIHDDTLAEWKLLTAAALSGIAAAALGLAVEYVKERKAFGVPIGWFQAIQHRLADVAVGGDGAELLTYEAAWAHDEGLANAAALASMAFLFASEVAFRTCRESLQFHGGYGYTLEYDIQLFFRRSKAWALTLGDPRHEYQRLAELLYPDPPERDPA